MILEHYEGKVLNLEEKFDSQRQNIKIKEKLERVIIVYT